MENASNNKAENEEYAKEPVAQNYRPFFILLGFLDRC
jgi:hypothetical protein